LRWFNSLKKPNYIALTSFPINSKRQKREGLNISDSRNYSGLLIFGFQGII
jgi:hypothetical protein